MFILPIIAGVAKVAATATGTLLASTGAVGGAIASTTAAVGSSVGAAVAGAATTAGIRSLSAATVGTAVSHASTAALNAGAYEVIKSKE